jgi:cobalamin synthase
LYDAFAASRPLLTLFRVAWGSLAAGGIAVAALGWDLAGRVITVTVVITLAAGLYGNAILGGMVGDYMGATIQVWALSPPLSP